MTGAYGRPEVAAWRSSADVNVAVPPAGVQRTAVIEVDRLATKHVAISAPASAPCATTSMVLSVSPEPGYAARPAYQIAGAGAAVPLLPGGSAVSWNTCEGLSLLLAVPNTSAAIGAPGFRVHVRGPAPPPPAPQPAAPAEPAGEPAPAAPAALSSRLRLPGGQTMASILRRGLKLRLDTGRLATARVTVTVLAGRRTRSRHRLRRKVTSKVVVNGKRTVALKLRTRSARRMPARLRLAVRVRFVAADGAVRVLTSTVTVSR
jgi:hypothetical protein